MTKNLTKNLKPLDLAAIPSFFPEPAEARNAGAGLAADRKLILRHQTHHFMNQMQVSAAVEILQQLPEVGESYHIINRGLWSAWALVPTILHLSKLPIRKLHIATLGFSRANGEELIGLIDAGLIGAVSLVVSCYFKSNDRALVDWMAQELTMRGQKFVSVRNHAKIIAADFGPTGPAITVETSANLRSCRNVEQFTITNDAALLAFHADWITTIVNGGDRK